jgi:hypothetical protein
MKYSKDDIGIFIAGASENNSTEQSFKILEFASANGMAIDDNEIQHAKLDYQDNDDLPIDFFEDLGYAVEEALDYLNNNCCEKGVAFTFRDTDFVLISGNGLDNAWKDLVE